MVRPTNWLHGIILKTDGRDYMLCAKTEKQRLMFIDGFNYVIECKQVILSLSEDKRREQKDVRVPLS